MSSRIIPDGEWIAFITFDPDGPILWRIPGAGGAPEQLTSRSGNVARWSPDGEFFYFTWRESRGDLWVAKLEDLESR